MNGLSSNRFSAWSKIVVVLLGIVVVSSAEEMKLEYHGAGWVEVGKIENSFNSLPDNPNDYNENWLQNSGGVVNTKAVISDSWEGSMGLGVIQVHLSRGHEDQIGIWYPFVVPFVSEARIAYTHSLFTDSDQLKLTFGSFPYVYSSDTKNLGLYLLNGYVYPGALVSGFGGIVGAMAQYQIGGFRNDIVLKSETEDKPFYDFSLANVMTYAIHSSFEIGAGINFYRLFPQNADATAQGRDCDPSQNLGPYPDEGHGNGCFIEGDTLAIVNSIPVMDTITGSLAGTKVMARFRADPKVWLGSPDIFGKGDLVLYFEMAVIGWENRPVYTATDSGLNVYYPGRRSRMPVMIGFNPPALGWFDLSVEIENYPYAESGSNLAAQSGSWIPAIDTAVDNSRDDWKWSVNASKVLFGHMQIAAQVANDHLRPGGFHNLMAGHEALRTPKDWYWKFKMAYFF